MKNKFQESIHANHIGYVISEILQIVGAIFFLIAWITILNEKYEYGELSSLLEMRRYGLALVIGGFVSMIACACNIAIKSNDTAKNDTKEDKNFRSTDDVNELVDTLLLGSSESEEKNISENQNQQSDS